MREGLPFVASVSSHRDQKFAKLNGKIVLIELKLPAKSLCSRSSQVVRKLLQPFGDMLVLGENRAEARER